jgi:hypothetical protein
MQHAVFAAFLVIDHELDAHLSTAGPFRVGRVGAVAAHVTRISGRLHRFTVFLPDGNFSSSYSDYQRVEVELPQKNLKVFSKRFFRLSLMHDRDLLHNRNAGVKAPANSRRRERTATNGGK